MLASGPSANQVGFVTMAQEQAGLQFTKPALQFARRGNQSRCVIDQWIGDVIADAGRADKLAAFAVFRKRKKHVLALPAQCVGQAEHLPFRAAKKARRREVYDAHPLTPSLRSLAPESFPAGQRV